MRDIFEPQTRPLNKTEKRLLILDGHNSHTTLKFLMHAQKHNIIVLCLPPHTTHRLQPCDYGVFRPLTKAWGEQVDLVRKAHYEITKHTFLAYYAAARIKVMTFQIITSAFESCGIVPYNPDVVTKNDLAPAAITSTQYIPLIPIELPSFLEAVPVQTADMDPLNPSNESTRPSAAVSSTWRQPLTPILEPNNVLVRQRDLPPLPTLKASWSELIAQNGNLREQLDRSNEVISENVGQMLLMAKENEELRKRAFAKKGKKAKTTHLKSGATVLTDEAQMAALRLEDRNQLMGPIFKEFNPIMKAKTKVMEAFEKQKVKEMEEAAKRLQQSTESEMWGLKTEIGKIETKKKTSLKALDTAEGQCAAARTPSTLKRAEDSCQLHEGRIQQYESQLEELLPRYQDAKVWFDALVAQGEAQEDEMVTAEAAYQAALVHEKEAEEELTQEDKEKAERWKKLQQRPQDAVVYWKEVISGTEIEEEVTKDLQESVFLDPYQPRLPYGWYLRAELDGDDMMELSEPEPSPEDLAIFHEECRVHSNIDPELLMMSTQQANCL